VSAGRVIDWASDPKPVDELHTFAPWHCTEPAPSVCEAHEVMLCKYDTARRHTNGTATYNLRACLTDCPKCYPWINDEAGDQC